MLQVDLTGLPISTINKLINYGAWSEPWVRRKAIPNYLFDKALSSGCTTDNTRRPYGFPFNCLCAFEFFVWFPHFSLPFVCVCVCLPYYRKFSRNRSFAVFCGFFFKAKINFLGCGKRTPLLFVTRKTHNFSESQQISFREISPHKITN